MQRTVERKTISIWQWKRIIYEINVGHSIKKWNSIERNKKYLWKWENAIIEWKIKT